MFEVETSKPQDNPIFIHLHYCLKCDEYKGHNKNFTMEQEKEAVSEEFSIMYKYINLGDIKNYKTIIPASRGKS
jgi:hypothetical protein